MLQVKQPNALRMSHAEVDKSKTATINRCKEHKKIQNRLRQEFKRKVDKCCAIKYKTTIEAQAKMTKNAFKSRQGWRQINTVLDSKKARAAITFVESTNKFGIECECTSTKDIYQACRTEGQERYDQANTTPLMQNPLLENFGTLGNQATIDQVLAGTYQRPPDTPEYIHELKQPDQLDNPGSITGHMTMENFIGRVGKRCGFAPLQAPSDPRSRKSSLAQLIPISQILMPPYCQSPL
jgi:hypothetical protein